MDMGKLHTTMVVARLGREKQEENAENDKDETSCPYSVLAVRSDDNLGAFHYDQRMFEHFQGVVSGLW